MGIQNLAGQLFGQYEMREILGIGGMGAVYRAYQASLKRQVAVKVLPATLATQPGYMERFNREAETAASLEHPHIIPVYDYGMQRGTSYIVMRLLTGGTLADRIEQHENNDLPLPSLGEIADLLKQLASALDYAHSRGVVHRDIKPSNVMFDNQGNAFLMDFGIAKLLEATQNLTGSGITMGTPSYMSPEQWRADKPTAATDQYALGGMVYVLITGRVPFEAPTPYGLMHKHLNETPTPPQFYRPGVPKAVATVLERAMAKQPADRFPTITAFTQAFEQAIQGESGSETNFFTVPVQRRPLPVMTAITPTTPHAEIPFYRRPALWGIGAVLVALLALGAFLLLNRDDPDQDPTASPTSSGLANLPGIVEVLGGTSTETPSLTAAPTDTPIDTITETATSGDTQTVAPTATPTETPTPSNTPDLDASTEALFALRLTQTATAWTATPILTNTPLDTPTETAAPSDTPDLEASTEALFVLRLTQTATALTATPTPTNTPTETTAPTDTPTETNTPTDTATNTPTVTLTATATHTPTNTPTSIPSETPPPTPSPFGAIVFVSERDGNREIYVMDTDGANSRRLTSNTVLDSDPVWSPDGSQIAFVSERDGNPEIYIMNADGTNLRRLTNHRADDYAPTWSPDGSQIAFDSNREGSTSVYIMEAAGGNPRWLANGSAASWSPDGLQMVFTSSRDGNDELYVIDVDGSDTRRLTNATGRDWWAAWSPDGSQIAFTSERDGNLEIYVMEADGDNPRRVTNHTDADWWPAWSPDGQQIVFSSNREGSGNIYTMDTNGANMRQLTAQNAWNDSPDWRH